MTSLKIFLMVCLLAVISGCGDDDVAPMEDAAVASDAGVMATDAGEATDAGSMATDAGEMMDGSVASDAGVADVDAGVFVADAG
jgi:PBP1b-binding outer membrane lipoprotein LpoB